MNQSEEIYNYIREHPGTNTEDIVQGTGWNRHLVEMALTMMIERELIIEIGRTEWDDPMFQVINDTGGRAF